MGSATAYHLAKRGARVLGLEQFNIGHDLGSSHGVTRIIRLAYAEGSSYVPMLRRADTLWRAIQRVAREPLLFITGGVDAGPQDGTIVQGSLRSCREHRLQHEQLDAGALRRRFPGYRLPDHLVAVYQPDAGFVLSERAIIAYVTAAQSLGAEIHGLEQVRSWKVERGRVVVHEPRHLHRQEAGHHGRSLGIPGRSLPSPPTARHSGTAGVDLDATTSARQLRSGSLSNLQHGGRGGRSDAAILRLSRVRRSRVQVRQVSHRHEVTDLLTMDRGCHPRDEKLLRAAIRRYFPRADGPTLAMKTCLFTNSPDEHFVIGKHPEHDRVVIAAGFSGHGFKFASAIGEILAELALDGAAQRFDLTMFDPSRRVQ